MEINNVFLMYFTFYKDTQSHLLSLLQLELANDST